MIRFAGVCVPEGTIQPDASLDTVQLIYVVLGHRWLCRCEPRNDKGLDTEHCMVVVVCGSAVSLTENKIRALNLINRSGTQDELNTPVWGFWLVKKIPGSIFYGSCFSCKNGCSCQRRALVQIPITMRKTLTHYFKNFEDIFFLA